MLGRVVGIKDRILDEIAQCRLQRFCFAHDLQPFLDVEGHRSGARQRILAGTEVAADQRRKIDGSELETGTALFEAVGGQKVVDESAEAFGITEHGIDKNIEFFCRRPAQTDRFEMETQGGEGGFKFVSDLGDKILLGLIESDLPAPEMVNNINTHQKEGEEKEPLDENKPVRPEGRATGPYFCASLPRRR